MSLPQCRMLFHLRFRETERGDEVLLPVYVHVNELDLNWFEPIRDELLPSVCELVCDAIVEIERSAKNEAEAQSAPNRLHGCPHCIVAYTTSKRAKYDVVSLGTQVGERNVSLRVASFVVKLFLFPLESEETGVHNVFL